MCSLRKLLISVSIWLALAGAPAEALGPAPLAAQPRVRIEPAEIVDIMKVSAHWRERCE